MATSPNYIDSILEKLPTLATLVLEPLPPEAAGAAEAATLRQLLVGLEQAGVDAGLRGIPYLFRMLYKLPMRWPLGDIGEADQDSFNDWIAGLYDHLQGRSDTDGAGQLLGHLCRLSWMPRLEPRLTEILLKTLGDDAAALRQRAQMATLPPLPADTDANAFTADEGATADGAGTFAAADTNDTNDTNEEDGAAPDTARQRSGRARGGDSGRALGIGGGTDLGRRRRRHAMAAGGGGGGRGAGRTGPGRRRGDRRLR
jgi:hypothetical protein